MSIGGSSSKSKTTTSESVNPGAADPYVRAGLDQARALLRQGAPAYYRGDTVADLNPVQNQALMQTVMRSAQGTPDTTRQASDALSQTLSGQFLNPQNPYTQQVTQGVLDSVIPRVQSMFTSAGRTGSNANMEALTKSATDAVAPYLFNQYGQERQNQVNATMQAPAFDQGVTQNDFSRLAAMLGAGNVYQGQTQQEIDADKERFDYRQNAPWLLAQNYQALVNPYAQMYRAGTSTSKGSQSGVNTSFKLFG